MYYTLHCIYYFHVFISEITQVGGMTAMLQGMYIFNRVILVFREGSGFMLVLLLPIPARFVGQTQQYVSM